MMHKNSQEGMTLVMVLLMITVFSILVLSVMGYAISNAKQVDKSKQEMQAVDLAEMGVIYYKNLFITNATNILENVINVVNDNNVNPDMGEFYAEIQTRLHDFKPTLPTSEPVQLKSDPLFQYQLEPRNATWDPTNHLISVEFISTGKVESKVGLDVIKALDIKINLNVDTLVNIDGTGNIGIVKGGSSTVWDGTIPSKPPELTNECQQSGVKFYISENCYSNGDLINIAMEKNRELYVGGDGIFLSVSGGISGSKIYIVRNGIFATINGQIKNSYLYIGGNAIFNGALNGGIRDSVVYVGGDLTIADIKGNDKLGTSKVCVRGDINPNTFLNNSNVYSFKHNETAFNANCPSIEGNGSIADLGSNISSQLSNMKIDYNYGDQTNQK